MTLQDKVWTLKYAPKKIEDLVLSDKNKTYFSSLTNIPNNLLFLGRAGCGKTTLAKILANKFSPNSYLYINASDENGIDIVRNKITDFISTVSFDGKQKIVILDECDGLSFAAQSALRGTMEEYLNDVKFILTGNFKHKLLDAILSRCQTFDFSIELKPVTKRIIEIIKAENIKIIKEEDKQGLMSMIKTHFPDIRKIINELQGCCINGVFKHNNQENCEIAQIVFDLLQNKSDIFKLREQVISKESEFNNDYHFLMKNLFDLYIDKCNVAASLLIADHMYKDAFVIDKEVNFSALIFNLSKL